MKSFKTDDIKKSLLNSVVSTFADMAFVEVISENSHNEAISHKSILGLTFIKPCSGSLLFYMTKECKKQLVENIYGEDWTNLNDMEIDDCLLEILNVLAGQFLKNLCGDEERISMSFPKLFFDQEEIPFGSEPLEFIFNGEGAMFRAKVEVKD